MACVMDQSDKRRFHWQFGAAAKCPRCNAQMVVYCTKGTTQHRRCPRCGETGKTIIPSR